MTEEFSRAEVEAATVRLVDTGGLGVLVTGDIIVTAAHCINSKYDGSMIQRYFIHNIDTVSGKLKAMPLAVEALSDVAILGAPDNQELSNEAEEFEEFCSAIKPVPICLQEFILEQEFRIHIYTHESKWITGTASLFKARSPNLWVTPDEQVPGGTSGGPIVNDAGELVAIVSMFGENIDERQHEGPSPRPHLALPVWVSHDYFGLRF